MSVLLSPASYGLEAEIHLQPFRPYHLFVSMDGANSNNVSPKPARRRRHDIPNHVSLFQSTPWTYRTGQQRGRVWLHRSSDPPYNGETPGPYVNYRIHLKNGVFFRHARNHTFESYSARLGNHYGFGPCRSKELNGQISIGDFILRRAPRVGQYDLVASTAEPDAECNVAHRNLDTGFYEACPFTVNPDEYKVGRDSSPGDYWEAYARMQLDIPQGATIVGAGLTLYFGSAVGSFDAEIAIINADDVDPLDVTDANTYPVYATSISPVTLSPASGGGAPYILNSTTFDFTPLIQHIVNRSGWSSGNSICFRVKPVGSFDANNIHKIAYAQSNPSARLAVRYRTDEFDDDGIATRPPLLFGYQRLWRTRNIDTSTGPEMNEAPGGGVSADEQYESISDHRMASAYRYLVFAPVPNVEWWDVGVHGGSQPYPDDAHIAPYFCNEIGTYEVPCVRRVTPPWRYESLNKAAPFVSPGLRAVVAYAEKQALPAIEPIYHTGCSGQEGKTAALQSAVIQRFQGQTATVRTTFSDLLGYWIEHTGYVRAWFVYSDELDFLAMPIGVDPDDYGPYVWWNIWWEIIVKAKWSAPDPNEQPGLWDLFKAQVNNLDNKFGAVITPRTDTQCNDHLLKCAGITCALGDTLRITEAQQEACADTIEPEPSGGRELPCVEVGNHSWVYVPTLGSNHPMTTLAGPVIPQLPEYGLYHEFKRKAYTTPDAAAGASATDYGWCAAYVQSNHPIVRGVSAIDPFPRPRIERWRPFVPINTETLIYGYWQMLWTDLYGLIAPEFDPPLDYFSDFVDTGASVATVQAALDTMLGAGNSLVSDGGGADNFLIEFIGDLLGENDRIDQCLSVYEPNYYTDPADEFAFERTVIQEGRGGGYLP